METAPQSRWTHKHCITQCTSVEPPSSSSRSSPPSRHHPVSSPLVPLSSPSHVCVLQWRDSGLKTSLSIGMKFSSPSCCHPISSLLLSLLSTSCFLSSLPSCPLSRLSPSHVCVLQWRDSGLKVLVYWYSIKLLIICY